MTKKCELTGKRPLKGHKVSHANNKVKRRFLPGIKKVNFKSDILNKSLKPKEFIFAITEPKFVVQSLYNKGFFKEDYFYNDKDKVIDNNKDEDYCDTAINKL